MIPWVGGRWRRFTRWFDRAYWALRVLPLSKYEPAPNSPDAPGLILIQIDGLSQPQFRRALDEGRLPFLRRLIKKEKYVQHAHYSGVPSTTPAVQGELFFGVPGCVTAFHFKDKETDRVFTMFEPKSAAEIERRLAASGNTPLLKDGSSYANIFCGGAAEPHFCAAGISWRTLFRSVNPLGWPLRIIFHGDIYVRTFLLAAAELFISLGESLRGAWQGKGLMAELRFVLMRVVACVYLRDLTSLGGRIDIARGLPVIHLNFFGYDEQAHRRGPDSDFAHRSLRGIDAAIARVYRQAAASQRRDYDVWFYSDHGQEGTIPYFVKYGRRIDEAVAEVFEEAPPAPVEASAWIGPSCCIEGTRPRRPRAEPAFDLPAEFEDINKHSEQSRAIVTGMGPLAHIYPPVQMTEETTARIIRALLEKAHAPMVLEALIGDPALRVRAHTLEASFLLPDDAARVLADNHPFLNEAARDLMNLCHHPNAGRLILSGWKKGEPPITFPMEYGSHAGFGPNETSGFALLPADAPVRSRKAYLRPADLRAAALRFLGRPPDASEKDEEDFSDAADTGEGISSAPVKFRVMTYNVHGCVGMDGKLSPDRIARVIARHNPDVIALQELDVSRRRSGQTDQARAIAQKLQMDFHFHAVLCVNDEKYGNAILSRHPMRLVRANALPKKGIGAEPRGAMWAEIDIRGEKIQFFNTHLSIWQSESFVQAQALQGADWLNSPDCPGPRIVICGDFNSTPNSPAFKAFRSTLRDVQLELDGHRPHKTLPAFYPVSRIDHVFIGSGIRALAAEAPRTRLERVSSDHLPLIAELELLREEPIVRGGGV